MTTRTTISAAASVSALALGALCAAPALGQENGDVTLDAPAFAEAFERWLATIWRDGTAAALGAYTAR